ncbi:hypothetical protein JCM5296_004705 [Sporobolomyces johnsonii]
MHASTLLFSAVLAFAGVSRAHMSIWSPAMYGVGPGFSYDAGNPVNPLGPDLTGQDDWWFRGPSYRALPPQNNAVEELPAGGSITFEIACHVAWTSYGVSTTTPGSTLDACPGANAGPYHSGDPNAMTIDQSLLSGCALGIADVENIEDVTMDNLAIFSVNHNCVKQKETSFEVPAAMPACTGSNCICAWFWLANNGTANFYMTGFNCTVTGASPTATPIAPPQDPVFCKSNPSSCTSGSKRPIYAYNTPSNVPWIGNNDRAGYHASWSFPNDGAQNDIFLAANATTSATASSVVSSSSSAIVSSVSVVQSTSVAQSSTFVQSSTLASSSAGISQASSAHAASSSSQLSALPSSTATSSSAALSIPGLRAASSSTPSSLALPTSSSSATSTPKDTSSSVAPSSTSQSLVWHLVTKTGVVDNPKSRAATTTRVASSTVSSQLVSSSSSPLVSSSTSSAALVWTKVTSTSRIILAKPLTKRSPSNDTGSPVARHARDFRIPVSSDAEATRVQLERRCSGFDVGCRLTANGMFEQRAS